MKGFAEKFQQYSVDEAFLVPGPEIKSFEEAVLCASKITDEILKQERITRSVGIGPNKLVAILSNIHFPAGKKERSKLSSIEMKAKSV